MKTRSPKTYVESFAVQGIIDQRIVYQMIVEMYVVKMNFASSFPPFIRVGEFRFSLN